MKSPKGLYIRQPRASAASPWEKASILRTLKGFNREGSKRGKARFVVPLQGTKNDDPVTQGGASLALG